jgi:hypothetical protein
MECLCRLKAVLKRFDVGGHSGHKNHEQRVRSGLPSPRELAAMESSVVSMLLSLGVAVPVERRLQESVCSKGGSPLEDGVRMAQLEVGVAGVCGVASRSSAAFGEVTRWFISCITISSLTSCRVRPETQVPFSRWRIIDDGEVKLLPQA